MPANLPHAQRKLGKKLVPFAALFVMFCGLFLCAYSSSSSARDAMNALVTGIGSPKEAFGGRGSVNILLLGQDITRDSKGRALRLHGRTDTMMLAHVDFNRRFVSILSIPRDTLARIPGIPGERRINIANAHGGPKLARESVSHLTGKPVDYYMLVNLEGFEKAIDCLGGLNVTVDKRLDYDDNGGSLHIHLLPGPQTLNGEQAMGYVRYRQSNHGDVEPDLMRIQRQQALLGAVKGKLLSPRAFIQLPGALKSISHEMEADMTPGQMLCLGRFVASLPPDSGLNLDTLPVYLEAKYYLRADPDEVRFRVDRLFSGKITPR